MSHDPSSATSLRHLKKQISACTLCIDQFEHGVRPVVQLNSAARILIAGQAPGRKVFESGIPFDDPSGERLRQWLGVERDQFYDEQKFAILPMAFCYPGTGKQGDLAPPKRCAETWRAMALQALSNIELTLVIGQYAQAYHLQQTLPVTEAVKRWQHYWPTMLPLPHPSPRNNRWLAKNPWFEKTLLPPLQARVQQLIS